MALFDFFFVPPRFTFAVSDLHYVVTFGVMLVTASVISWLAERVRAEAVSAEARERGTAALVPLSAALLGANTIADVLTVLGRQVRAAFGADVRVLLREPGGRLAPAGKGGAVLDVEAADREVAEWAFRMWQPAGAGTAQFPTARSVYLPLVGTHGRLGVIELRPDDPDRFGEPVSALAAADVRGPGGAGVGAHAAGGLTAGSTPAARYSRRSTGRSQVSDPSYTLRT